MLVDIDAARERRGPNLVALGAGAAVSFIPITAAGGIADVEMARACIASGADKIMVTSAALDRPALIGDLARTIGVQAVVVGIDLLAAGEAWHLYDHRLGRALPNRDWRSLTKQAVELGAGELRLLAVGREGTRRGLDLALHAEAAAITSVPIVLEG